MRLGGPTFPNRLSPDDWISFLRHNGYRAAYCPVTVEDDAATINAYAKAALSADVVIAEVGAWSNPISSDPAVRQSAMTTCQQQLALAEEIGALCCVNIAGSRAEKWDGPHPKNLTRETFDLIVESVQQIIDAVKPKRAFYTLETMPWIFPDSPESYLELILAINRPQFAVHLDLVNLVNCPSRFFDTASLMKQCCELLGAYIKSCHAKDVLMTDELPTHLLETLPGKGVVDYRIFINYMNQINPQMPLMLEHLSQEEEYQQAAEAIRSAAGDLI
jgi:sugar phosphate isomerase/epimerase